MKNYIRSILDRHLVASFISAFILNLVIEIFSRRSLYLGLQHMISSPLVFLLNVVLLTFFYYLTCLFKRKSFAMLLVTVIWFGMGITNFIVLGFRTTPLGAIDFKVIKSALNIVPVYLSIFQIIVVCILIIAVIAILIYGFIRMPKYKPKYKKSIIYCISITFATIIIAMFSQNTGIVGTRFMNLVDAYSDYGFVYCFMSTLLNKGVAKPNDYSEDAINEILTEIDEPTDDIYMPDSDSDDMLPADLEDYETLNVATEKYPNIIFLQLESFFDVNKIKDFTYSENPVPVFQHLKRNYSTGYLTVPTVGAGTANTEFEVLTGMSLQFFGPGEYPYTTILQSETCESINYNLKEVGYRAQAIHDHTGGFYDRNEVYKQLGFDTFTSIEYMQNVKTNPLGWAKDSILTEQIMKALKSTPQRDFVFAISVQGHGKYPNEVVDENQKITVQGIEDETKKIGFEYYVNQINEMDSFIGSLISTLENFDEPVILVMYGDHLPAFEIEADQLVNDNIFQTEYIVWNNLGWSKKDKDIYSYQLSSNILSKLEIDKGILTRFHNMNSENPNYLEELNMLEHDMLYGDKLIYNGITPYQPTELQMGIDKILIKNVKTIGNDLYVIGENFTKYSEVFVNDKKKSSKFKNGTTIIVENIELSEGDVLTVNQTSDDWKILSKTDEYIYHENDK